MQVGSSVDRRLNAVGITWPDSTNSWIRDTHWYFFGQCLHNNPAHRPSAQEVLQCLEQLEIEDPYQDLTKIEKIRRIEEKEEEIRRNREEIRDKEEEIGAKDEVIRNKDVEIGQKEMAVRQKDEQIRNIQSRATVIQVNV